MLGEKVRGAGELSSLLLLMGAEAVRSPPAATPGVIGLKVALTVLADPIPELVAGTPECGGA